MRLRNIEGSIEAVEEHRCVVNDPKTYRGRWNTLFGNTHPIEIEIGMGKGDFIIENALRYPEKNFIGIEKFSAVLYRATEKIDMREELPNLVFLRFDAIDIHEVFGKDEIQKIYLNFSDPWPKDRWAKRRLTYHKYLEKYAMFLDKEGSLEFKTDNNALFEFSLEEIRHSQFQLVEMTRDLHRSDYKPDNIMTEYETRFLKQNKKINYMKLIYK
ncbi:tRNA (guanosine(46)-N7)-methyltransferase TrmB [Vallitaleaceae bacterium 9-2]